MRILRMLVTPNTSKIYVWVTIDGAVVSRIKNKTSITCILEILPDMLEGSFMGTLWFKSVPYILMYYKCTVRMAVSHEIQ